MAGAGIEIARAIVGGYPQTARRAAFVDGKDVVGRQVTVAIRAVGVGVKIAVGRIETVEPESSAHPCHSVLVLVQSADCVVGEAAATPVSEGHEAPARGAQPA